MGPRVVLHLQSPGWERRWQLASLAISAAAAGDAPLVVLWFDPLVRFVEGRFDEAEPATERASSARAAALDLPAPSVMLEEARSLGARVVACETGARLAGIDPAALAAAVDDVLGMQQLLEAGKLARHTAWL